MSRIKDLKQGRPGLDLRKKLALGAVGAVALGGLGLGLGVAHAAPPTPAPTPPSQSAPVDAPTPGDTADTAGTADTPEPGDAQDANEPNQAEEAAQGTDPGPDVQQTGEHTDPGDLPGSK